MYQHMVQGHHASADPWIGLQDPPTVHDRSPPHGKVFWSLSPFSLLILSMIQKGFSCLDKKATHI